MDDQAAPRKLASIVAVDVAGYSRRTEADEDGAIAAVTILKARVTAAARAYGGRVFNTAGDGFMLEFPTATGALAAAELIANSGDPPVRVGVHLGEVSATESGDLLGHGVNVAARIQQMASPGAVLVSGDVKRAVRGPLGERLKPQGIVRLDKMDETLPVFALAPAEGGQARGRRRSLKAPALAGAGAAFLALAGFVLWPGHGLVPPAGASPTRLAILPFEPLTSSPEEHAFATGLADALQSGLSASQMPVASREDALSLRGPGQAASLKKLGVRLLLDGTVAKDGDTLRARVRLDDPGKHVTLWSVELSGPASATDALEAQVGARATAVINCAGQALRPAGGLSDPEALKLYLHACDLLEDNGFGDDARAVYGVIDSFRQVTVRAPGFAPGHSALARTLANYKVFVAANPAAEVEREARRALAIDPKDVDAYVALSLVRPTSDYAGRERLLDQALAANPSWPSANLAKAILLNDVGLIAESVPYAERAAAANPLSLDVPTYVFLAESGRTGAADAELERLHRLWPHSAQLWFDRIVVYAMEGRYDEAQEVLDDRGSRPKIFSDSDFQLLRTGLLVRPRTPAAIAEVRRRLLTWPVTEWDALQARILMLSKLGLVDDAFDVADRWARGKEEGSRTSFLFGAEAMRRDPRFIPFAARLGLVDYWRNTGKWPDFCAEPGLTYDCKAEAAKVTGHR
jgi:adenylate cyclase